jgi:hypothetical protein
MGCSRYRQVRIVLSVLFSLVEFLVKFLVVARSCKVLTKRRQRLRGRMQDVAARQEVGLDPLEYLVTPILGAAVAVRT